MSIINYHSVYLNELITNVKSPVLSRHTITIYSSDVDTGVPRDIWAIFTSTYVETQSFPCKEIIEKYCSK